MTSYLLFCRRTAFSGAMPEISLLVNELINLICYQIVRIDPTLFDPASGSVIFTIADHNPYIVLTGGR